MLRKKRILFVVNSLTTGGTQKVALNLAEGLADKFEIIIVSFDENRSLFELPHSAQFHFFPRAWRFDLTPSFKMRSLLLEKKVDLVVCFEIFSLFYTWLATRGKSLKIFLSIHSTHWENVKHRVQHQLLTKLITNNKKVIAVCHAQAKYWQEQYGLSPSIFSVIYNGVDTKAFSPINSNEKKQKLRSEYMIPENAFVILKVASFHKHKRHEDALLAFAMLQQLQENANDYLVLVGSGSEDRVKKIKEMAAYLGLQDQILIAGEQKIVLPFYHLADVATLTSSSVETFSMVGLEAMAAGLPLVLTNVGGAKELVVQGETGYLTKARDVNDIAETWLLVKNQYDKFDPIKIRNHVVQNFSIEKSIKEYSNFFEGQIYPKL